MRNERGTRADHGFQAAGRRKEHQSELTKKMNEQARVRGEGGERKRGREGGREEEKEEGEEGGRKEGREGGREGERGRKRRRRERREGGRKEGREGEREGGKAGGRESVEGSISQSYELGSKGVCVWGGKEGGCMKGELQGKAEEVEGNMWVYQSDKTVQNNR